MAEGTSSKLTEAQKLKQVNSRLEELKKKRVGKSFFDKQQATLDQGSGLGQVRTGGLNTDPLRQIASLALKSAEKTNMKTQRQFSLLEGQRKALETGEAARAASLKASEDARLKRRKQGGATSLLSRSRKQGA